MARRVLAVNVPVAADAPTSVAELVFLNQSLTLPEACDEAHCSLSTIQRAYVRGHLRILPFGARGKRVRRRDLIAWVEAGCPTERQKDPQ